MNELQTVHALSQGYPLCGFSKDFPAHWPTDHVWTYVTDLQNTNCCVCKQRAMEMVQPEQNITTMAIGEKGIVQVGATNDCEDGGILRI